MQTHGESFLNQIAEVYATYFDAVRGFEFVGSYWANRQEMVSQELNLSIEELDRKPLIYGEGDPREPDAREMLRATQGVVKARNAPNGENAVFLGQMLVVAIYQLWEDHYRALIAKERGYDTKNDLKLDAFGDFRNLRNAIIHNKAIATTDCEKNRILNWFSRGDRIQLTVRQVKDLLFVLSDSLRE